MPTAAAMDDAGRSFIPAFGKRWLLPLYDPFLWLFRADATKRQLIGTGADQIRISRARYRMRYRNDGSPDQKAASRG